MSDVPLALSEQTLEAAAGQLRCLLLERPFRELIDDEHDDQPRAVAGLQLARSRSGSTRATCAAGRTRCRAGRDEDGDQEQSPIHGKRVQRSWHGWCSIR